MRAAQLKIFDSQVHVEEGLDRYDLDVSGRNFIFNSLESYRTHRAKFNDPRDAVTILLEFRKEIAFVHDEIGAGRAAALKIHSRIQRIVESEYAEVSQALATFPDRVPVVVDAFFYGPEMKHQPSLPGIIHLLKSHPKRKFVIAHCGGHHVLDFFFHLRPLANAYYDLSLSLQYLADSSRLQDLVKLIRHTDKSKIMFGSDYPGPSPKAQYETLTGIFSSLSLSERERQLISHDNAATYFSRGA